MQEKQEDLIANVIHASHLGGSATCYTVHHTAERVMLVFGLLPGQHKDMLLELISRQTGGAWVQDYALANLVGAKMALGPPHGINSLKERLASAGVAIRA